MIKKTALSQEIETEELRDLLYTAFGKNVITDDNRGMVLRGSIAAGMVKYNVRSVTLTVNGELLMFATNDDYSDKFEPDVVNAIYNTLN